MPAHPFELITPERPKYGAAQINMVDYKFGLGIDPDHMKLTRAAVRGLLDSLRTYTTFIPKGKDKTVADIDLASKQVGADLSLLLHFGKSGDRYIKPFDLPLPPEFRGRTVADLHEALSGMSQVDPGGNVPNMIRNLAHVMQVPELLGDMQMELYTTQEPLFMQWFEGLPPQIRERFVLHTLNLPSRKGLHLPYDKDAPGEIGTLGIGTPMYSTLREITPHFPELAACNQVLTSESLYPLVSSDAMRGQYREFQNPSTAFREQCAIESYNHMLNGGKQNPLVAMNDEEMPQYVRSLEQRRAAPTSAANAPLSFVAPFDFTGDFSEATMETVSTSFQRYFACVTPRPQPHLYFPLNVSCGGDGGYHVACTPNNAEKYAIFTSTPDAEGEKRMLDFLKPDSGVSLDNKFVMGAGDSVATVLSLANYWDIEAVMRRYAGKEHPLDDKFIESAAIIFVSLLSRYVGSLVYHSKKCDWSDVPPESFPHIIESTAKKSLVMAQETWGRGGGPQVTRDSEWGVNLAMWQI